MNNHEYFLNKAGNFFRSRGYSVSFEVPLSKGKGAVDLFASKSDEKIYSEIKSSPASLKQKKVRKQLDKYVKEFGKEHKYALVSPDARGKIKIDFQQ